MDAFVYEYRVVDVWAVLLMPKFPLWLFGGVRLCVDEHVGCALLFTL